VGQEDPENFYFLIKINLYKFFKLNKKFSWGDQKRLKIFLFDPALPIKGKKYSGDNSVIILDSSYW